MAVQNNNTVPLVQADADLFADVHAVPLTNEETQAVEGDGLYTIAVFCTIGGYFGAVYLGQYLAEIKSVDMGPYVSPVNSAFNAAGMFTIGGAIGGGIGFGIGAGLSVIFPFLP
jgi:hypothetical protein